MNLQEIDRKVRLAIDSAGQEGVKFLLNYPSGIMWNNYFYETMKVESGFYQVPNKPILPIWSLLVRHRQAFIDRSLLIRSILEFESDDDYSDFLVGLHNNYCYFDRQNKETVLHGRALRKFIFDLGIGI